MSNSLQSHGSQASLSITNSWSLFRLMSIELVMPSNHLILCHPLLLLPSIFLWNNSISACHQHLLFYCWPSCSLSQRNSSLWHRTSKVACVQFSSVAQSCPTICGPMDCSTPDFPVHHQLLELVQTHVHRVSDAIQPSHPLSSPSPPAFNLSQHQGLFKWVSSSHQEAKGSELQLQHQSFQWIFRTDFL